jgi:hypothetical protein
MGSVKKAFEARLKRKIAANPERYRKQNKLRKLSPEGRYQMMKEAWYFHKSSWYMRESNGYDGYGCNQFGCIPECRYYPQKGRMEENEKV